MHSNMSGRYLYSLITWFKVSTMKKKLLEESLVSFT